MMLGVQMPNIFFMPIIVNRETVIVNRLIHN